MAKEKEETLTFEDLYGEVPQGPASPAKQVAVDNYNQTKNSIAEFISIEALMMVSAVVAGAVAFWQAAGFGTPVLAAMADGSVNLLFPEQHVKWDQMSAMGDTRTKPYMTSGDETYLFQVPSDLFRRLNENQEQLSEAMVKKYV